VAIPCDVCGLPVHEQIVVCPHCGEHTGVPVDPNAERAIQAMPELPAPALTADAAHVLAKRRPGTALVGSIGRTLAAGIALLGDRDQADDDPLPRATARKKR
jgi:hypothetical protein